MLTKMKKAVWCQAVIQWTGIYLLEWIRVFWIPQR